MEDWCQQYPSHSIGDLAFGPDGALYARVATARASSSWTRGRTATPVNPCGDPPGRRGHRAHAPDRRGRHAPKPGPADGGRSGDTGRSDDPDGSGDRSGAAVATRSSDTRTRTPDGSSPTGCAIRSVSRFRPATSELWVGDVGWGDLGGDQPDRQPDRLERRELRLAMLRGAQQARSSRQYGSRDLREPLRSTLRRHEAVPRVPAHRQGCSRGGVPFGELLDLGNVLRVLDCFEPVPVRLRRRALLRGLLTRLHLGHEEGWRQRSRSWAHRDARVRRGESRGTRTRVGRSHLLRGTSTTEPSTGSTSPARRPRQPTPPRPPSPDKRSSARR